MEWPMEIVSMYKSKRRDQHKLCLFVFNEPIRRTQPIHVDDHILDVFGPFGFDFTGLDLTLK